jgi:ATP-dependent RNA helicase DDX47/RRP3
MMAQAIALSKKPHIIVATPGRLVDHLENTRGFNLKKLRFLVLDEADRLLNMDFGPEIDKILRVIPATRRTFLFSATMTSKVAKLQRASLVDPVKVEVSTKYSTVDTLLQYYVFLPAKLKDCYFVWLLNELAGKTTIVFVATCATAQRLALMVRNLGFAAVPLHGQMPQPQRIGALAKFRAGERGILIATDVASRGLDIPAVDCVLNYDIPANSKDYVHRVGRTARAGRTGKSVSMVTQYDVEGYQRIEQLIGKRLPIYDVPKEAVGLLQARVYEAQRIAMQQIREEEAGAKQRTKRKNADSIDTDSRPEYAE